MSAECLPWQANLCANGKLSRGLTKVDTEETIPVALE
jgi:hypothetical protein